MKTNHRARTYNIRYMFLSYTLVQTLRYHHNKWLMNLSHCFDAVKFSAHIILTGFALHEMATKEQNLVTIILRINESTKYLYQ